MGGFPNFNESRWGSPLGPLCSAWPVGTLRGAKLHLGDTLGHAGPVDAWGFAGTYHKGLVNCASALPTTHKPHPQHSHKPAAQPGMMYSLLLLAGMAAPLTLGHFFAAPAVQMVAFPTVLTSQHVALLSAAPLIHCLWLSSVRPHSYIASHTSHAISIFCRADEGEDVSRQSRG